MGVIPVQMNLQKNFFVFNGSDCTVLSRSKSMIQEREVYVSGWGGQYQLIDSGGDGRKG